MAPGKGFFPRGSLAGCPARRGYVYVVFFSSELSPKRSVIIAHTGKNSRFSTSDGVNFYDKHCWTASVVPNVGTCPGPYRRPREVTLRGHSRDTLGTPFGHSGARGPEDPETLPQTLPRTPRSSGTLCRTLPGTLRARRARSLL